MFVEQHYAVCGISEQSSLHLGKYSCQKSFLLIMLHLLLLLNSSVLVIIADVPLEIIFFGKLKYEALIRQQQFMQVKKIASFELDVYLWAIH